jgi:cell division protein FtsW
MDGSSFYESSSQNELYKLRKSLLLTLGVICTFGVLMVFSSSYLYSKELYGNSNYLFTKQIGFLLAGPVLAFVVGQIKLQFWARYSIYLTFFVSLLLFLTFVPGFGVEAKGANRWLSVGPIQFQPGEIVKYVLVVASLYYFENFKDFSIRQKIINAIALLTPLVLLVRQPDFGTFIICILVIFFVCFLSSFAKKYFYYLFFSGGLIGVALLFLRPYRIQRLMSYLDPWKNPKTTGFQIIQSYLAFANGSFWGKGIGNSSEKLFYLPEAYNDFIFSVIGEELGVLGVLIVICLYAYLLYLGLKIATYANNRFGMIIVAGVVFSLGLQVILNMGVVLGLLPTKGLNLPFISYGGSSLLANFFAIGIILSVVKDVMNTNREIQT